MHRVVHRPQPMHFFSSTTVLPQLRQREASSLTCSSLRPMRLSCIVLVLLSSFSLNCRSGTWRFSSGMTISPLSRALKLRRLRAIVRLWPGWTKRWILVAPSRPLAIASMVYCGPVAMSPPPKISASSVCHVISAAFTRRPFLRFDLCTLKDVAPVGALADGDIYI